MALVAKPGRKTENVGVVGYCRVKSQELIPPGISLKEQEKAIRKECDARGYELLALYSDAGSSETQGRPALSSALASLNDGSGSILMVSKLDRLTRSMHVAARVLASAERGGWSVVTLDSAVDTTSTEGSALVEVLAIFDGWSENSSARERFTRNSRYGDRRQNSVDLRLCQPRLFCESSRRVEPERPGPRLRTS